MAFRGLTFYIPMNHDGLKKVKAVCFDSLFFGMLVYLR